MMRSIMKGEKTVSISRAAKRARYERCTEVVDFEPFATNQIGDVAKLADAPALGAGGGNPLEVQVLSSPQIIKHPFIGCFIF